MKELKSYDEAVQRFGQTLSYNSLPITVWDFYGDQFAKDCAISSDVVALNQMRNKNNWNLEPDLFEKEVGTKKHIAVVTDAQLNIVYATKNIWEMNRYHPEEVVGLKPKVFQGKDTCPKTLKEISEAIRERRPFEKVVLNYRRDGQPYKCWIKGRPIFNTDGELTNFVAFEREVA
ncbi:PAS domain-containing protein [Maribacter sp. 2307ULW6-5]|uniref:PAS domain-containing protein n=1 Tax=Maribacter sp. 2307ULW6-5 TaxID=3386275 RepID=UPI0039BCC258